MTSFDRFNEFAVARGDGLHPRLRDLFVRSAASPSSEVLVRDDGMLQAGPSPVSETAASRGNVMLLTCVPKNPAAGAPELQSQKSQESLG
jgi:hypothetical protein